GSTGPPTAPAGPSCAAGAGVEASCPPRCGLPTRLALSVRCAVPLPVGACGFTPRCGDMPPAPTGMVEVAGSGTRTCTTGPAAAAAGAATAMRCGVAACMGSATGGVGEGAGVPACAHCAAPAPPAPTAHPPYPS